MMQKNDKKEREPGGNACDMKIYICKISEYSDLPGMNLILPKRKAKLRRFLRLEDKVRCLVAGLMMNYAFGEDAKDICISDYGKLYFDDGRAYFNLSHGGEYVVMVTDMDDVGIDVEPCEPIPDGVAERVYTAEELDWLKAQKNQDAFYRLWTGKESIAKAFGLGFSLSPESFSVMPPINGLHKINDISWYMNWYELKDHALCVSSKNDVRTLPIFLHREQLLVNSRGL